MIMRSYRDLMQAPSIDLPPEVEEKEEPVKVAGIISKYAKSWLEDAAQAAMKERNKGASLDSLWKGFEVDQLPSGRLIQERAPSFTVNEEALAKTIRKDPKFGLMMEGRVGDLIDAPQEFYDYPKLKDNLLRSLPPHPTKGGSWNPQARRSTVYGEMKPLSKDWGMEQDMELWLQGKLPPKMVQHEVFSHPIQELEKLPPGDNHQLYANLLQAMKKMRAADKKKNDLVPGTNTRYLDAKQQVDVRGDDPFRAYEATQGEASARMDENRLVMPQSIRNLMSPTKTMRMDAPFVTFQNSRGQWVKKPVSE